MMIHAFARDGSDHGEIVNSQGMARYETAAFRGPEPFSPRAFFAIRENLVYVGESLTPRIRVLHADASPQREIVWDAPPGPTIGATLDAVVDSALASSPPDRVQALRSHLEAAPVPSQLSVFWGMLIDELGFIWVRPYEPLAHAAALGGLTTSGGAGGSWQVLSPDGVATGFVALPADLEPVHITRDAVVGIARDDLGVESVRVHSLRRR
jgi:hypothetical protein